MKIHHKTAAKFDALVKMLVAEYPVLTIEMTEQEEGNEKPWFTVKHGETTLLQGPKVPDITEVLEACEEAGLNPEELSAPEKPTGGVVAAKYRAEYKARGNPNHCGDWLADLLNGRFTHGGTDFNMERFTEFLVLNGVEMTGKWAALKDSDVRGSAGRYRMNGRQKLELAITKRGTWIDFDGTEYPADMEWLLASAEKHPKLECAWMD